MTLTEDGYLMRVFVGESDRAHGKALYEWIVQQAREEGLAGATVLRGIMGYGANSRIHTIKITRLSVDMPIVIELADSEERLERFLEIIDGEIGEGLVTMEKVRVRLYRSRG